MAGEVLNIKVCSPLKLHFGLTGKCHATCHYSYNLPLPASLKKNNREKNKKLNGSIRNKKILRQAKNQSC